MRSLNGVAGDLWDAGDNVSLARARTHSPPDVKTLMGHSLLAIRTAAFGRALVMLVAGLALCYGKSNNLT
jgi:hypothetical protein